MLIRAARRRRPKMPLDLEAETQTKLIKLMEDTGYPVMQSNGQRQFGPPPDWNETPSKGCEVFVGKLPRDLFEDELVPVFSRIGKIYILRLMMDFSGTNRGYCFVKYTKPYDAIRAMRELNNYEIRRGRYIGVAISVDNCRLYVGGLPESKLREDVVKEIRNVMEGVTHVIMYSSMTDKSKHRGFAFVDFEDHRCAALARRRFLPECSLIFGGQIAIDWAEPEVEVDFEIMRQVKILFVRNIMPDTTESTLRRSFGKVSGITSIEKVKKTKDFAFIHFVTREAAEAALDYWNGHELDGAELHVTWSKPVKRNDHALHKAMTRYYRCGVFENPCLNDSSLPSDMNDGNGQEYHLGNARPGNNWCGRGSGYNNNFRKVNEEAIVQLANKCYRFNFGEPLYQYMVHTDFSGQGNVGKELVLCKVTLPNCLGMPRSYQPKKFSSSPIEAQVAVCELVLNCIRLSTLEQECLEPLALDPGSSMMHPPHAQQAPMVPYNPMMPPPPLGFSMISMDGLNIGNSRLNVVANRYADQRNQDYDMGAAGGAYYYDPTYFNHPGQ